MNKLAERVLQIVDENGFDWWGIEKKNVLIGGNNIFGSQFAYYQCDSCGRPMGDEYSLADLATNKSFLEALAKFVGIKERLESPAHIEDFSGMIPALARDLQVKLIKDLTFNEGKNFWQICAEFIGLEQGVCCE